MSQSAFQKFSNPKKNSAIKESFRQEKKKIKKERAAYFDKVKEEKYQARMAKKNALANPKAPIAKAPTSNNKEAVTPNSKTKVDSAAKADHASMPLNKY
jgi:23S rRNA pseudouridine2605 synthase